MVFLAVLALAAFGLAACGGDDDEATDEAPVVEETEPEATEEEAATGEGASIEIEADPDGTLAYTTGEISTEAGEVTIDFDNPSSVPHDVRIEDEDGNDLGGTSVITDDSESATVSLEPGTYTYYCSVAGHREAGMEDTLVVE
jgi:plastocyanin